MVRSRAEGKEAQSSHLCRDEIVAFLGAREHRITAGELQDLERDYARLDMQASRSVIDFYQSRKNPAKTGREPRALAH